MLMENMQRSDLTLYEQAQGFQLMLDFGETEETIAQKTGFSRTTVRNRVKLLDLNKDRFQAAVVHGASLTEMIELSRIEGVKKRNYCLEQYKQANKRLHRQGQKHPVVIHHLVVQGGMDEDVITALQRKGDTQKALMAALKARIKRQRRKRETTNDGIARISYTARAVYVPGDAGILPRAGRLAVLQRQSDLVSKAGGGLLR